MLKILIKAGHFNLSTMLNLKRPMDALHVPMWMHSNSEHIFKNKKSMNLYVLKKIEMSMRVGEHLFTFAYMSVLTGSM
jgi:hypothetical protein